MIPLTSLSCASSSTRLQEPPATKAAVASSKVDTLAALQATDEARTIRHNQAVQQSKEWTREGQEAQRDNNLDRALDLYTRAANLNPGNSAAIQGRDQILKISGRITPTPKDEIPRSNQTPYLVRSNLDMARSAIERKEWENARTYIGRSRLAAEADKSNLTPEEMDDFHNRIAQTELELQKAMENAHSTQK
jgi:hypothetical protein